ncbi:FtsB family cell division protein [Fluviicola taffensis]|uniref:Septum formation initiator n=1 Tax=Fluviicola taffensis (strain DSM 16823 / NCIMB 13979 / RW262) TaxID=755732 RepID=F2IBB1_FLUTR|nr:septum formation initiator family protein [Fluviicola taffensis]AEA43197.1 Septum formation initiator [Fluviicola taffensis DSM 16823]
MKKFILIFKNKYILALTIFLVYNLFLDEVDVFTIFNQNKKISALRSTESEMKLKLQETKYILSQIKDPSYLEKLARENKLFKKDNEDIFVITYK